jgi:hypothetical protein
MMSGERRETDDLTAPATSEEVQAHADGLPVGQSETPLERSAKREAARSNARTGPEPGPPDDAGSR